MSKNYSLTNKNKKNICILSRKTYDLGPKFGGMESVLNEKTQL